MSRPIKILLIEDDADDVELLQEALSNDGVTYEMEILSDGSSALDYFKKSSHFPHIIIMDLNLPKVHGKELIVELNETDSFKTVPLLILTTSSSREDIEFAYKYGASNYLVKPTSVEGIKNTVALIVELSNQSGLKS